MTTTENVSKCETAARLANAISTLSSVRLTLTALRKELECLEPDTERAWTASVFVAAMVNGGLDAEQQLMAAKRELSK